MRTRREWLRHRRLLFWSLAVGSILFVAVIGSIIVMTIWPGEAKLTRPLFCDDARPDAFVVRDTYSSGTGESSTNFTMYCVGERGDYENIGWFRPMVVLWLAHTVLLILFILALRLWFRWRRRTASLAT